MSNQLPDLLPALKSWIQELGILPGGIYYRLPAVPKTAPFGRITRTGGGPDTNAEVPVSTITASVQIWGLQNPDYEAVRTAALALEQAVHDVKGPTSTGTNVVLLGANVLTSYDLPDPDTGWPRYLVSIRATGRLGI